jgi:hypothetical protein
MRLHRYRIFESKNFGGRKDEFLMWLVDQVYVKPESNNRQKRLFLIVLIMAYLSHQSMNHIIIEYKFQLGVFLFLYFWRPQGWISHVIGRNLKIHPPHRFDATYSIYTCVCGAYWILQSVLEIWGPVNNTLGLHTIFAPVCDGYWILQSVLEIWGAYFENRFRTSK